MNPFIGDVELDALSRIHLDFLTFRAIDKLPYSSTLCINISALGSNFSGHSKLLNSLFYSKLSRNRRLSNIETALPYHLLTGLHFLELSFSLHF